MCTGNILCVYTTATVVVGYCYEMSSDESSDNESLDVSTSDEDGIAEEGDLYYNESTEPCRTCACSGCETDTGCDYPSDDNSDEARDIVYWENKAHATQDLANYLEVDLRKQVRKTQKILEHCNNRVKFAQNERNRMKTSCREKILLLNAENKQQLEFSKNETSNLMHSIRLRDVERRVMKDKIDEIKQQLECAHAQLKELVGVEGVRKRARNVEE